MAKPESVPIDKIYVPVKRKKALKPELVQEIAESIMEIGQQAPIIVRRDEDRFVLIEGLHRFEACKALGETTIIALLVSAEDAHPAKPQLHDSAEVEAEREKIARLKKLRLEREAAEQLAAGTRAVKAVSATSPLQRRSEKGRREGMTGQPSQASAPKTLSEWITQQKRDGNRY
jgi:ParB/RepB/Spo0J family partition protein